MHLGVAADHAGFAMKEAIKKRLRRLDHEVEDFGANVLDPEDDYPEYIGWLAEAVANGKMKRGIAICGSGIGACIVANKFPDVRAGLCHDTYSARQGVQHNDLNILVIGARVIGVELAYEIVQEYLEAAFVPAERHLRRLKQIESFESQYFNLNPTKKVYDHESIGRD